MLKCSLIFTSIMMVDKQILCKQITYTQSHISCIHLTYCCIIHSPGWKKNVNLEFNNLQKNSFVAAVQTVRRHLGPILPAKLHSPWILLRFLAWTANLAEILVSFGSLSHCVIQLLFSLRWQTRRAPVKCLKLSGPQGSRAATNHDAPFTMLHKLDEVLELV